MKHPAGHLKVHPRWPEVREVAMRTSFEDGQFPGWTSWIRMRPSGTEFVQPETVIDWPDGTITAET